MLLLPTPAAPQEELWLFQRILDLDKPWDQFKRSAFGCSQRREATISEETCNPALAWIDYSAFRKSCEAAKRMWGLKGNCAD